VDEEVRRLVMAGYDQAKKVIDSNRRAVTALATALLDVESLDADQIRAVLVSAMTEPPSAAMSAPVES
jgi:cell division protease FtsH